MHLRRALVAVSVAFLCTLGALPLWSAPSPAAAASVDCTIYIYKPSWFFARGTWRPRTVPHGWKVSDWVDYCYDRFKPRKKGPDRPQGNWDVTLVLNPATCMWQTANGEGWLRDAKGWSKARIHVTVP